MPSLLSLPLSLTPQLLEGNQGCEKESEGWNLKEDRREKKDKKKKLTT